MSSRRTEKIKRTIDVDDAVTGLRLTGRSRELDNSTVGRHQVRATGGVRTCLGLLLDRLGGVGLGSLALRHSLVVMITSHKEHAADQFGGGNPDGSLDLPTQ
jgi:hypothetical protein